MRPLVFFVMKLVLYSLKFSSKNSNDVYFFGVSTAEGDVSSSNIGTELLISKSSFESHLVGGRMGRRFSETITIDDSHRLNSVTAPSVRRPGPAERSELNVHRDSLPKPTLIDIQIEEPPLVTQQKKIQLKRTAEAVATQRMELRVPRANPQRRYSETVASDRAAKYRNELEFRLEPVTSKETRKQTVLMSSKTSRLELSNVAGSRGNSVYQQMKSQQLTSDNGEGSPPFFIRPLESLKVMDGERVQFNTIIAGSPTPEIQWLHKGKGVQQNPDFHVTYDRKTGAVSLEISDVFPQDTGLYECIASNQFGMATVSAHLTVEGNLSLQLFNDVT